MNNGTQQGWQTTADDNKWQGRATTTNNRNPVQVAGTGLDENKQWGEAGIGDGHIDVTFWILSKISIHGNRQWLSEQCLDHLVKLLPRSYSWRYWHTFHNQSALRISLCEWGNSHRYWPMVLRDKLQGIVISEIKDWLILLVLLRA